jgi:hypothetical protein
MLQGLKWKAMTKDEALVYAVEGNDAFSNLMHGGETCRGSLNTNMGAARMERDEENHRFVTTIISLHDLHGNNVVIYACVDNVLVGRCIHLFLHGQSGTYTTVQHFKT